MEQGAIPCSSVELWNHIDVFTGVIDEDYHGNISVIIFNHSQHPFFVSGVDQIAQIICQKFATLHYRKLQY
jgi:dUTP pyrophosphatase